LSSAKIPVEGIQIRRALAEDAPDIRSLIDASIRGIGGRYYDAQEIESSLTHLFGVDSTMIADGTYFVATVGPLVVGAGGWSNRMTPFGGDQATDVRNTGLRDPQKDSAVIRAMYVHPEWARMKIGQMIITTCEYAARKAGFTSHELVATLSGIEFYTKQGYTRQEKVDILLSDGIIIEACRMTK
jgi:GNAT superfamily N-acetyltransferase